MDWINRHHQYKQEAAKEKKEEEFSSFQAQISHNNNNNNNLKALKNRRLLMSILPIQIFSQPPSRIALVCQINQIKSLLHVQFFHLPVVLLSYYLSWFALIRQQIDSIPTGSQKNIWTGVTCVDTYLWRRVHLGKLVFFPFYICHSHYRNINQINQCYPSHLHPSSRIALVFQ